MVKTKTALIASTIGAVIIGGVHYISHNFIFNNPALTPSNNTLVGIVVTVATFVVAFVGMKWRK